jgi:acetolactate synthase-1/2/3 large subunit
VKQLLNAPEGNDVKGSRAIAEILKIEGVEFVSAFPEGDVNTTINAVAEVGIRTILPRNERVVVNIADGYTRVSNRIGVAIVAGGVGASNAFPGVSQAFSDLVPILVFVGQLPRNRLGVRSPQNLDHIHIFYKVTKWVERINFACRVPEFMRRAFTYLKTGRPSPIVLEVPQDVSNEEFDDSLFSYKPVKGWKTVGDPHDIQVALRSLLAAKNPIIYVGEGVLRAQAWDELRTFAELLQIPVMTTMKAKGVFPENHPLSVGSGGRSGGKPAAHFMSKADLVFSIGASLTKGYGAPISSEKILVQSVIDELDVNKDYFADFVIIGDAKLVLKQLIAEVEKQGVRRHPNGALLDEIKLVKEQWLKDWMPKLTSNEKPINPYRVIWDLSNGVDKESTIVTPDAGGPRDQLVPFYEVTTPWGCICWGHQTILGYSLGGAMGAKLAHPEETVINVMGDGAFGMVGMDFETAVREKIPIITIILNNSALGWYTKHTPSTSILSGNYAKIAEGLGGYYERVEEPDDIIPAIKRAKKSADSGRAALVEVITKIEWHLQEGYWWKSSYPTL